uniref:Sulfate ABC transporter ATP-binding subunit n=1 Tax=Pedobesia claviformis TaxID=2364088 RepID=A0A386B0S4_9CHLO|nr:Sulfate ABC transporter ATP-binding subunit [Pedobesia claviformis]AYC65295.1 Sulfate ABC transporter ATP-binding subunit [Pedobesia claviformis]
MSILIENLSKSFNNQLILNQINLEIQTGHLVSVIGPSGSGKSTLLRIIAGFEPADKGAVWLNGQKTTKLSIQNRQIGFVFQDYALFPNLTIFENIAFGLRQHQLSFDFIESRVKELIQLVQLDKQQYQYPFQLSGGQKQRVAFARALVIEPKLLLLDEPFGALDLKVRRELREWLYLFHNLVPMTTVLVTHDQYEAFELGDEIIVFNSGKIEQIGLASELKHHPSTPFVSNFLYL